MSAASPTSEDVLETDASGERRQRQRTGDGQDHLRQEEQPVLAGGQVVAVRTGEDRGGSRYGDEAESLEQSRPRRRRRSPTGVVPAYSPAASSRGGPSGRTRHIRRDHRARRHPMWLNARESSTSVDADRRAVVSNRWSTASSPHKRGRAHRGGRRQGDEMTRWEITIAKEPALASASTRHRGSAPERRGSFRG